MRHRDDWDEDDQALDDERVLVVEQKGGPGIGTFLLGLAIGAGAALLFAPASGQETRERLRRQVRRAGGRVRDVVDDLGDEFTDRVDRARDGLASRAQAMADVVDVGRDAVRDAREELERALADSKRAYAEARRAYRDAHRRDAMHGDPPRSSSNGHDATEQAPHSG
ncbi:MAG: YtxH domain-containing protein [Gemmatimonadaceae bacterium]